MKTKKILIVLDGGIVQDVLCDGAGVEVLIKDFDVDGISDSERSTDSFGELCYYRFPTVTEDAPDTVTAEFDAAEKQIGGTGA